ncbi:MAG: Ig-like domain-containing protein, partial [Gemmatimonadetes bacterium]|nr:Ig-like domain-containing protein [Gemmatimonadota bacterium]
MTRYLPATTLSRTRSFCESGGLKKSWIVAAGHRGAGRGRFDRFRRGRGDLPCLLAVLLSAIVLGLHACDDGPVELPAVQIELTPDTLTLRTGESAQLTAVVQNARNVAVSFSTSNAAVATVTSTGLVT